MEGAIINHIRNKTMSSRIWVSKIMCRKLITVKISSVILIPVATFDMHEAVKLIFNGILKSFFNPNRRWVCIADKLIWSLQCTDLINFNALLTKLCDRSSC